MKLGLLAGGIGPRVRVNLEVIKHAETLGFDSVWTCLLYTSPSPRDA